MVQLDNPTTPNKIENFSDLVNILQRYDLFKSPKNGKPQMRTFIFTEKRKSMNTRIYPAVSNTPIFRKTYFCEVQ